MCCVVEAPAAELQQQAADMTAAAASSPAVLGYYTEQCHPQLRAQTVYVQLADQSAADFKRDAAMQQQVIDNDSLSLSLSLVVVLSRYRKRKRAENYNTLHNKFIFLNCNQHFGNFQP